MLHTLRKCVDLRILVLWWQIFKEDHVEKCKDYLRGCVSCSLVSLAFWIKRMQLILKRPKLCFEWPVQE